MMYFDEAVKFVQETIDESNCDKETVYTLCIFGLRESGKISENAATNLIEYFKVTY